MSQSTRPQKMGTSSGTRIQRLMAGRPRALVIALAVTLIEMAAILVAAVWVLVDTPGADEGGLAYSITLAVVMLLLAGMVFLGVQALWRGYRWGRGPVVTWQVLQAIVGITMIGVFTPVVCAALTICSGLVIIALFSRSAMKATQKAMRTGGAI